MGSSAAIELSNRKFNYMAGLGNPAISKTINGSISEISDALGSQRDSNNNAFAESLKTTLPSYSEQTAALQAQVNFGTVDVAGNKQVKNGQIGAEAQSYVSKTPETNGQIGSKAQTYATADFYAKAAATKAVNYSAESSETSNKKIEKLGAKEIDEANRINKNGSVNPYVNENFSDFKNYNRKELEGYFGNLDKIQNQTGGRSGNTFPPTVMHQLSQDSEFRSMLGKAGMQDQAIQNLWDRTSQIIGAVFEEGSSKFEEAAISTLNKFQEAGLDNLLTRDGVTMHDQAEVLAHAMKNNISVEGLQDFGKVYDSYLSYRDNIANTKRVTKDMMNHYYDTKEKTGTGVLPQGERGASSIAELNATAITTEQMRKLAGDIFQEGFDKMVTALGYDAAEVNRVAAEDLNLRGKTNHDPSLMAAIALSNMMGKEDAQGNTGWDKLVNDSRARDGDPKAQYEANAYISMMHDSTDIKTDGAAFVRSEGGILGLDALTTLHSGGLRNNPFAPNTLAFGYQGSGTTQDTVDKDGNTVKSALTVIKENIAKAREAGIAVNGFDNLTFSPSGHGGTDGGILAKSGRADADKTTVGLDDAKAIAKVLVDNTKDGGTIKIDCDACFGGKFAEALHKEVLDYAKSINKNIKSEYSGSIREGSMLSNSFGETVNGGDTRVEVDETGSTQVVKHRGDLEGSGNINSGTGYSLGKESYELAAKGIREEKLARAETIDQQAKETQVTSSQGNSRAEFSFGESTDAWTNSPKAQAELATDEPKDKEKDKEKATANA